MCHKYRVDPLQASGGVAVMVRRPRGEWCSLCVFFLNAYCPANSSKLTLRAPRNSMCNRNPSCWNTVLCNLVRLCRRFPWWQSPSRPARLVLIQLALLAHEHFHHCNPDEVAVFSHVPLSRQRPSCNFGENIFGGGLRALTDDTGRSALGCTGDLIRLHLDGRRAFCCAHCLSQRGWHMGFDRGICCGVQIASQCRSRCIFK
jgi:hypothetical protein